MGDLGRVHQRTAQRVAAGVSPRAGASPQRYDRQGRTLGERNTEGRLYEVCVMCGARAMVRGLVSGTRTWKCESCHYRDNEHGPLN